MKKLFVKCLCLLLTMCLMPDMAALAEDADVPAAEVVPEDVIVTAEAMDAAVAEAEADLDAADDDEAVPEEEVDLDAAYEGDPIDPAIESDPDTGSDPQEYLWEAGSAADGDALFAGYVDRLFGLGRAPLFEARNTGGDLTGAKRALYDVLKGYITEAAAGERESTQFVCPYNGGLSIEDIRGVIDCLTADCPYELYWHNNHRSVKIDSVFNRIIVSMGVGSGYGQDFTIDTAKVSRAQDAAANARAIVDRYAGTPDYDRLVGYRDAICDMTSYNDAATESSWHADNTDPWQLVWVFDGDATTDVVCEGYARAFQYLCDMTDFNGSVMCYSVTGTLDGWGHKWNIVRMPNGKNYLADLTQCDQEQTGTYDWVFMKAPTGGSVSEGYSFSVRNGSRMMNCHYQYDAEALGVYSTADLTLSPYGYADEAGQGSVEYDLDALYTDDGQGSGASSGASGAGVQTLAVRRNARATVAVGSAFRIETGGAKGTRFKSSNRRVARVSSGGLVTPRKAGKARITFRVGRRKRTLTLKVVDPTVPAWVALNLSGTVAAQRGGKLALVASIPEGTRSGLKWKSSNRKVASVNKNGLVTFKRPGRATVTVTTKRGKRKARVTFVVGG
ncbi:MAG: Ig-like domain-containing protein [Clostridia bacterium]|nr:Ig-like domain-containing protein [Clostridia bacterium]